jgi:hypothetical protein
MLFAHAHMVLVGAQRDEPEPCRAVVQVAHDIGQHGVSRTCCKGGVEGAVKVHHGLDRPVLGGPAGGVEIFRKPGDIRGFGQFRHPSHAKGLVDEAHVDNVEDLVEADRA